MESAAGVGGWVGGGNQQRGDHTRCITIVEKTTVAMVTVITNGILYLLLYVRMLLLHFVLICSHRYNHFFL